MFIVKIGKIDQSHNNHVGHYPTLSPVQSPSFDNTECRNLSKYGVRDSV